MLHDDHQIMLETSQIINMDELTNEQEQNKQKQNSAIQAT